MLILKRRVNQRIMIGKDVIITALSHADDGQMRIGIDAPEEMGVYREEIYLRIQREKEEMIEEKEEMIEEKEEMIEEKEEAIFKKMRIWFSKAMKNIYNFLSGKDY